MNAGVPTSGHPGPVRLPNSADILVVGLQIFEKAVVGYVGKPVGDLPYVEFGLEHLDASLDQDAVQGPLVVPGYLVGFLQGKLGQFEMTLAGGSSIVDLPRKLVKLPIDLHPVLHGQGVAPLQKLKFLFHRYLGQGLCPEISGLRVEV